MQTLHVYQYLMSLVRGRGHDAALGPESPAMLNRSFRDETPHVHVICSNAGCLSILRDASFVQPKIADAVAEIGRHLQLDVHTVEAFLRHNPIQMNGEPHSARRRLFLDEYNSQCKDLADAFRQLAKSHFERLCAPASPADASALTEPYVDDALRTILQTHGSQAAAHFDSARGNGYAVFEYVHPPARLAEKSRQAADFLACLAEDGGEPAADRQAHGVFLLSYVLQGRDPLAGGLAAFVHGLLELGADERAARIEATTAKALFWHSAPVNYIGRVATQASVVDGIEIGAGDHILLMLPWASHDSGCTAKDSLAFGGGPHVCAGQALALTIAEAWLWALKQHHRHIDWAGLKPGRALPVVFRQYRSTSA